MKTKDIMLYCARKASGTGVIMGTRARRLQVGVACLSLALGVAFGFWMSFAYGCILLTAAMLWPSPRSVRALEESTPPRI